MSGTLTILPEVDVANAGAIVGSSTYFGAVDDNPHDGNTSYVRPTASGQKNIFACSWDGIQDDEEITSVTVRWVYASASGGSTNARAGLQIDGVEYLAPLRSFSGPTFITSDEVFTTNPATGLAWQMADLGPSVRIMHVQSTIHPALGFPRLTQIIARVELETVVYELPLVVIETQTEQEVIG